MQRDAQQRAERYRLRAEELQQLGHLTANAMLKEHYKKLADAYLILADDEDHFAVRLGDPSTGSSARRRFAVR